MHPRWEDQSYPDFCLQRCTQCKRCTEECPFGTLDEDEKGTPMPNLTRCRRCGICLGACPERIISFKDYSVDIVSSMIKSVEIPDEFEEKPRLLGLLCENDAYPALDIAGLQSHPAQRLDPVHPGPLPGGGEHRLDRRRPVARLRRHPAGRLQVGRRLPVPLHPRQRADGHPRRQHSGEADSSSRWRKSASASSSLTISELRQDCRRSSTSSPRRSKKSE